MNKSTTMNIRIDLQTHQQLKDFADEVGIPAASLVKATIKQMLRNREVTFGTMLEPTPYLKNIMRNFEKDLKTGKNLSPVFDSVDDMFQHLEQDE